jgi:hypothetical protein
MGWYLEGTYLDSEEDGQERPYLEHTLILITNLVMGDKIIETFYQV